MAVSNQFHAPGRFTSRTGTPLHMRLGGPHCRYGRAQSCELKPSGDGQMPATKINVFVAGDNFLI